MRYDSTRYVIPREFAMPAISRTPFTIIHAKDFSKVGSITSECTITIARLLHNGKLQDLVYKILSVFIAATNKKGKSVSFFYIYIYISALTVIYFFS